jgi:CBS domain containing-hemolysin-like protein
LVALIAIVLVVLAGSFLCSSSEAALLSVSKSTARVVAEKGARGAKNLVLLKEDMYRPVTVILVFNNLFNVLGSMIVGFLATRVLGSALVGVVSGILVLLIILIGEIIPKSFGENHAVRISLALANPVMWLTRPLSPFLWVIGKITRPFRRSRNIQLMEEEIRVLTQVGHMEGSIEEFERNVVNSVFEFADKLVKDVMVPRLDMITLKAGDTVEDALLLTVEHGYTRMPVYEEDLSGILGVLHVKDLARHLREDILDAPVTQIMRDAFIVPETKRLGELLPQLKDRKVHMAVAVDEFGTVVGIVTIEDMLEEIIGDISDEFDLEFHHEVEPVERIGENTYRVDAGTGIENLNELIGIEVPPDPDFQTAAGLALKVLGHLPVPGEVFEYYGATLTIERMLDNRIATVLVHTSRSPRVPPNEV